MFLNSLSGSQKFKLYISPYQLEFKKRGPKPLEGALLAFDFGLDLLGYSDFLPWPRFGEISLYQQLRQIKKGEFSQRFLIAKKSAFLDAKARSQKRSLFFGLKIPDSHFLIPDLLSFKSPGLAGQKKIKVKLKPYKINRQISALKALSQNFKEARWRLDFNGMSWELWKNQLKFLKPSIDFIEDPRLKRASFEQKEKILFAGDWKSSPYFQIRIIKPSRDRLDLLIKELALFRWKRVIFTHSFDHPLGQLISAFWAGQFYKRHNSFFETGGLADLRLKEKAGYPLSQKTGPRFSPPGGFGFGFGSSLKKEPWRRWL